MVGKCVVVHAYKVEPGWAELSRKVLKTGLEVRVVGKGVMEGDGVS